MKVFFLLYILGFSLVASNAQTVWQANLDGKIEFYQTTDFGIMLAGTDNALYAIDGKTGERLWRRDHKGLSETSITPVPGTDLILFTLGEGKKSQLEAIDLLSGNSIWQSEKVKGEIMQLAVEPEQDLLAVVLVKKAVGKVGDEFKRSPQIHVLRLSDGDELWKCELASDVEMMPAEFNEEGKEISHTLDNYRAPLILDGRLFLFYEGATSYDARTGEETEREKFKINEDNLALTEADPVFDEKRVYISGRGKIRAVDRKTGNIEWKADDLGVTPEMAVVGNVLFVRTGGQFTNIRNGELKKKGPFGVSAIDTTSGKTLWRYKGADKGLTNFIFSDANTIFIGDDDDLIAIDAKNGKRLKKIEHDVEKAQFVLSNERGEIVVGGRDEIKAFNPFAFKSSDGEIQPVWTAKHKPPSRGIFRIVAGIALRAAALYFRYGGLATSALNFARGAMTLRSALALRWSGLKNRFSTVDLATLASNSAKNYVASQIRVYGIAASNPSIFNRISGLKISAPNLPSSSNIRGKIIGGAINKTTPSRSEVQEGLLERLDPVRQVEKLSDYFLRRKRLADIRGNFMYYYTDLPKPYDKKGLVGVNVHTGEDARFIRISDPDLRFTTDETLGLLYSADGNRLQVFNVSAR